MTPEPNDRTPLDFTRALELADGTEVWLHPDYPRPDGDGYYLLEAGDKVFWINRFGGDVVAPSATGPQIVRNRVEEEGCDCADDEVCPRCAHLVAAKPDGAEPFGYWIEQKHAEPALLRKPAYIPESSELRTVTPLYTVPPSPQPMSDDRVERVGRAIDREWNRLRACGPRDLARAAIAAMDTPPQDEVIGLLREALKPFARAVGVASLDENDSVCGKYWAVLFPHDDPQPTIADIERTRTALAHEPAAPPARDELVKELDAVLRWFDGIEHIDWQDIVADGGITAAMVIQQEARTVQAPRLRRALTALARAEQGEG